MWTPWHTPLDPLLAPDIVSKGGIEDALCEVRSGPLGIPLSTPSSDPLPPPPSVAIEAAEGTEAVTGDSASETVETVPAKQPIWDSIVLFKCCFGLPNVGPTASNTRTGDNRRDIIITLSIGFGTLICLRRSRSVSRGSQRHTGHTSAGSGSCSRLSCSCIGSSSGGLSSCHTSHSWIHRLQPSGIKQGNGQVGVGLNTDVWHP
eukprot:1186044-Prorocentrum_minimum.AAC.1